MKKSLFYLILLLLISFSSQTYAVVSPAPPTTAKARTIKENTQAFNKKSWEAKLGRKLNFRERISLRILQKRKKKETVSSKQNDQESPDGFALAGMISGLLGVLLSILLVPLGAVIAGVVAIVISSIGMKKTEGLKGFRKRGRQMAVAGLVLGILVTVFWIGLILILLASF